MNTDGAARQRLARVDQIIPSIVEHDAVSNHTFAVQRLLREMGYASEIYAHILGPGIDGRAQPLASFDPEDIEQRWVVYQCSIGSPAAERFAAFGGVKLLDYHNITPAELVERWLPPLGAETRLGREQLAALAGVVDFAMADSPFNARELDALGYRRSRVVPVLIEAGNIIAEPDEEVRARFANAAGHDWLFVGQIAPHKAQHDVVMAFARYRALFDSNARLHLVGREMGSAYRDALLRFVRRLGLAESVFLPGSVSTSELAAYYAIADVFVCLSDHEGFCAPLIEAMSREVPVVAFAAAAVPETVGEGAVVIEDKEPDFVAAVVHELFGSPESVAELRLLGKDQALRFTLGRAEDAFRDAMSEAVAGLM